MNGLEKEIESWLVESGVYPFSVLYVKDPQFLKISFFLESDITEILEKIRYKEMCDTSGVQIIMETKTILLTGMGLINFLRYVDNQAI